MNIEYDFDREIDRRGTNSRKWDRYRDRDILPMWIADSDFAVLPEIQQALVRRAEHPIFGYSQEPPRLVELLVERMQRNYGWRIEPDWLVFVPGVVSAMYLSCRAVGVAGDPVYLPEIIYPPFTRAPKLNDRQVSTIPMTWCEQRLLIDLDRLDRLPTRPGQLLMFCNPQNPGGAIYREAELRRLARFVVDSELVICSDEIHCDLILDPDKRHIPIASLGKDIEQRTITLMAPSKTFNLAGMGCGFAIVPDPRLRAAIRLNPYISSHANLMGLAAAEAAYACGDEWLRQLNAYLAGNRDLLVAELNRIPGLKLGPTEATYLAWIDVSELELDDPLAFFEAAGVGMSPGAEFGDVNFMRLNFACPRSRVEMAVDRIRRAIAARA